MMEATHPLAVLPTAGFTGGAVSSFSFLPPPHVHPGAHRQSFAFLRPRRKTSGVFTAAGLDEGVGMVAPPNPLDADRLFETPKSLLFVEVPRGGDASSASETREPIKVEGIGNIIASFFGAGGVAYSLLKAVRRVVPIALEPFRAEAAGVPPLTTFQLALYAVTCIWFAYAEGYKGFQCKLAPLVVTRSITLKPSSSPIHHIILAPFYSTGLFHASQKRQIVSWCVTLGIAGLVATVKRFPYPWRNIIDGGVVVGLTWGATCIILGWIRAVIAGRAPEGVDPAMPSKQ